MVAIVVFPQPGGPHNIVDGKRSSAKSLPKDEPAANAFWPTSSDNFLGRTRSAKGLLLLAAAAAAAVSGLFRFVPVNIAWPLPSAEEYSYLCEFVAGGLASAFFGFKKGDMCSLLKTTPDDPEGVTVAAAAKADAASGLTSLLCRY